MEEESRSLVGIVKGREQDTVQGKEEKIVERFTINI